METKLLDLPEGCLSLILSLTSPLYVLRCSFVCKLFNSIANSDLVWLKFLPSDWHSLIQRSSTSPSTKQIVLLLCRSSMLLEDGHMSYSLDKWTGKKSYMLGARRLTFAPGDFFGYWRWKPPLPKSRFPEVAELLGVEELYMTGRISTQLLSPNTTYRIYFSFMLEASSSGFQDYPVRVFVSRIDTNGAYLGGSRYDASKTFYLKAPAKADMFADVEGEDDTIASDSTARTTRSWTKIDMGKYFNGVGCDVALLEMTLMGTEIDLHKSGLIVHGIELQPID